MECCKKDTVVRMQKVPMLYWNGAWGINALGVSVARLRRVTGDCRRAYAESMTYVLRAGWFRWGWFLGASGGRILVAGMSPCEGAQCALSFFLWKSAT